MKTGTDPGFEKGGGAVGSGARLHKLFLTNVGQFRGLFNIFGTKRGERAPPAPPSGSAPGRDLMTDVMWSCFLVPAVPVGMKSEGDL